MKPFRKHHLLSALDGADNSPAPLDRFLAAYFREHKAVGSKDRREICDTLYAMVRLRGLLDSQCQAPITWEKRLDAYQNLSTSRPDSLAPHVAVSFPKKIYTLLENHYGKILTRQICEISNTSAPTTVRVNTLKTTRDDLVNEWKNYDIELTKRSPHGISFKKKLNFFALPAFKEGLFEVQDEGSQLIAALVAAKPGDHVLDYCAGAAGKTLAFAPQMKGKGQIYLHDVRASALAQAKKRLKRAGIQNAQVLGKPQRKMDWVLVDVPCTGSGTWRRNPDLKWKFSETMLSELVLKQRQIVKKALPYLKDDGYLVYATCSLFPQENEEQIAYFEKELGLELWERPFKSLPVKGGMDGFFGAVFKKKKPVIDSP